MPVIMDLGPVRRTNKQNKGANPPTYRLGYLIKTIKTRGLEH